MWPPSDKETEIAIEPVKINVSERGEIAKWICLALIVCTAIICYTVYEMTALKHKVELLEGKDE